MNHLLPSLICVVILLASAFQQRTMADPPTTQPTTRTTASGLTIVEVKAGDGDVAKAGDTVSVHYTGKLKDGTKFDSSYDRNEPIKFIVGANPPQVIAGWN